MDTAGSSGESRSVSRRSALLGLAGAAVLALGAGPAAVRLADDRRTSRPRPLPRVRALDPRAFDRSAFLSREIVLARYLVSVEQVANAIVEDADDAAFGWIGSGAWRPTRAQADPRVMEQVATLSWFLAHDRAWNPYYRDRALAERLRPAVAYHLGMQLPDGSFPALGDERASIAATGFGLTSLVHLRDDLRLAGLLDDLHEPLDDAIARAASWVLAPDAAHWAPGRLRYVNQHVGALLACAQAEAARPELGLRPRIRALLQRIEADGLARSGHSHEPLGYDFGYAMRVMLPDLAELEALVDEPEVLRIAEAAAGFALRAVHLDPGEERGFHHVGISERTPRATLQLSPSWDEDDAALARRFVDRIPALAALQPSQERRAEWEQDWYAEAGLPEPHPPGLASPRRIRHVPAAPPLPTAAERAAGVRALDAAIAARPSDVRADEGGQVYAFLARDRYRVGLAFDQVVDADGGRPVFGPQVAWAPRRGAFVLGGAIAGRSDLDWGVEQRSADGAVRETRQRLAAEWFVGAGATGDPVDLPTFRAATGPVSIRWQDPAGDVRSTLTLRERGFTRSVAVEGGASHVLPLLLHPDDELLLDAGLRLRADDLQGTSARLRTLRVVGSRGAFRIAHSRPLPVEIVAEPSPDPARRLIVVRTSFEEGIAVSVEVEGERGDADVEGGDG